MNPTKEKILTVAASLVRKKGFNSTGIQEILREADVPKGSFYFHFESKEQFGLDLIDLYGEFFRSKMEETMTDKSIPGLTRIKSFLEFFNQMFEGEDYTGGCPIGNFAQEMGDVNENFRSKISKAFGNMENYLKVCLRDAVKNGEIKKKIDIDEIAEFILNSWEGAIVRMKVKKTLEPIQLLEKMVFKNILT